MTKRKTTTGKASANGKPPKAAPKSPGRRMAAKIAAPIDAQVEANILAYHEKRTLEELRENAFCDMPVWMFESVEDLIRMNVESAVGRFGANGRITENRLSELHNDLIEATALASALLMAGECLR